VVIYQLVIAGAVLLAIALAGRNGFSIKEVAFKPLPPWASVGMGVLGFVVILLGVWPVFQESGNPTEGVGSGFPTASPVMPVVEPTAQPPSPTSSPLDLDPVYDRGEDGVPASGSPWTITVPSGELRIITGGPMCVEGHCFPGGETRGTVVALLPRTTPYVVTKMLARLNWLGHYTQFDGQPKHYQVIVDDRVASMHQPGNCTRGAGCKRVDVLIIGADVLRTYSSTG